MLALQRHDWRVFARRIRARGLAGRPPPWRRGVCRADPRRYRALHGAIDLARLGLHHPRSTRDEGLSAIVARRSDTGAGRTGQAVLRPPAARDRGASRQPPRARRAVARPRSCAGRSMSGGLPRAVRRLLALTLPEDQRDPITGELEEAYAGQV